MFAYTTCGRGGQGTAEEVLSLYGATWALNLGSQAVQQAPLHRAISLARDYLAV